MAWPSSKQDDAHELLLEDHNSGHLLFDPIDCPVCMDAIQPCPWCGEIGGDPVRVEDSDPSTGYGPVVEERCSLCLTK